MGEIGFGIESVSLYDTYCPYVLVGQGNPSSGNYSKKQTLKVAGQRQIWETLIQRHAALSVRSGIRDANDNKHKRPNSSDQRGRKKR
jgi:hypothetical protein